MRGSPSLLAFDSLMRWLRAPGYLVVIAVALVPAGLTGAWAWTHDADIAVTGISWDREAASDGDALNITAQIANVGNRAVDSFNVTLRVGYYETLGKRVEWRDVKNETVRVGPLASGAKANATITWNATAGAFQVEAWADVFTNEIKEIEDLNNYRPAQISVRYPSVRPNFAPPSPEADANSTNQSNVNVSVSNLGWTPANLLEGDNATFVVNVANAGPDSVENMSVALQVLSIDALGQITGRAANLTEVVNLTAGENKTLNFTWRGVAIGSYGAVAFARVPPGAVDASTADNVIIQQVEVQRRLIWKEPDPQATAKDFYRNDILLPLQFTLLVPLVGIFFAGNVLQDDRVRGNLPYLLTRPVPRWWLPLVRFGVGLAVALGPVLIGVFLTYGILLGTPRSNPSYLYWPIIVGALVTFLYTAVFTLVGVMSRRPYLVGLVYVLGFETLLIAGRRFLINGQPLVQDWVMNFSLSRWVGGVFEGWDPAAGFQWLPANAAALRAVFVILGIGAVSLAAACWIVTTREVEE